MISHQGYIYNHCPVISPQLGYLLFKKVKNPAVRLWVKGPTRNVGRASRLDQPSYNSVSRPSTEWKSQHLSELSHLVSKKMIPERCPHTMDGLDPKVPITN